MPPGLVKLHCFLAHHESFLFHPLIEMNFENPKLVVTQNPSVALLGVPETAAARVVAEGCDLRLRRPTTNEAK